MEVGPSRAAIGLEVPRVLTMSWDRILCGLAMLPVFAPGMAAEPATEQGSLRLRIVERMPTGQLVPAPARIHLAHDRGQPVLAPGLPAFRDHINCHGELRLDLPPGAYNYTVERGPEYGRASGHLQIVAGAV